MSGNSSGSVSSELCEEIGESEARVISLDI